MLELDRKLDLETILTSTNLADVLDPNDVTKIANRVVTGYAADKSTRREWEENMATALELALQVTQTKTEPWAGASNVKFPLVTIAALAFHARIYPLLVPGVNVAKCRVIGKVTAEKTKRAARVATHMSWQLLEQDTGWEEEHDKALLIEGIMGTVFKKSYFDTSAKYATSRVVNPNDLILDYYTSCDVNMATRATHRYKLTPNEIYERVVGGYYTDLEMRFQGDSLGEDDPMTDVANRRQGLSPPPADETSPVSMLEQLCWYDLDCDGYAEPYVATVEEVSGKMRRLVARFVKSDVQMTKEKKPKVYCIEPTCIYTRYELIPAPDGGFYGLGFGRLLGPINESVNSMLNMLIDAGTLSNYGGGFLGRGAKFRGGVYTFKPQEWKQVDAPGDDLRKNIVPLMVREPSMILFQLLVFLIGYGERIASANELQMGENIGQNTPAATARVMNENGARVFAAIYKRNWRSFRDELRVRYGLNKIYLEADAEYEDLCMGTGAMISPEDYRGPATDVRPAADPTMIDNEEKKQTAELVAGLAFKIPGFNRYLATRRMLEARNVPDIDEIFPMPPPPQGAPEGTMGDLPSPPDPKMLEIQIKQGKLQLEQMQFKQEQTEFAQELQLRVMEIRGQQQKLQAETIELQARAAKEMAEAKGVETGHMVGILQTQVAENENQIRLLEMDAQKVQNRVDMILGSMKIAEKQGDIQHKRTKQAAELSAGGSAGVAGASGNGGIPAQPGIFDPGSDAGVVQ